MDRLPKFSLKFVRRENHFVLPRLSTITLTQSLYDILFQYIGSEEKEKLLKDFIERLEQHIKSKSLAPFSLPVEDLEFLEEGLQELKLLNWLEIPVVVNQLIMEEECDRPEEIIDTIMSTLEQYMTCIYNPEKNLVYLYPANLVR